jgi:hypothetical protein
MTDDVDPDINIKTLLSFSWIAPVGAIIVWLASLLVLIYDLTTNNASGHQLTISGIVGAVIITFMAPVIIGYQSYCYVFLKSALVTAGPNVTKNTNAAVKRKDTSLYEYLYYGGNHIDGGMDEPPSGDGYIVGKFVYKGKPAVGVRFNIVLNNKYQVSDIISDEDGKFSINVASGDWHINVIQTKSWVNKPENAQLMLTSGKEARLSHDYLKHDYLRDDGLDVAVPKNGASEPLVYTIKPRIELIWPTKGKDFSDEPLLADFKNDSIKWVKVEGAENYRIEISSAKKIGNAISLDKIYKRVLDNVNEYSLSEMPVYQKDGKHEAYAVVIQAFDKDGKFISETRQYGSLNNILFKFNDNLLILNDKYADKNGESFNNKLNADAFDAEDRYKAVIVLVQAGMYHEASEILATIDGKLLKPSKKMALEVYVLSASGRCGEAFDLEQKLFRDYDPVYIPVDDYNICNVKEKG